MKKTLVLSLAIGALIGTSTLAWAQDGGDRPRRERGGDRAANRDGGPRGGGPRDADGEHRPPPRREEMLKRFDKDGDGQLSEEERTAAFDAMLEDRPQLKERLLERFDANDDGKLDDAEKQAAREEMRNRRGGGDGEGRGPGFGGGEGRGGPGGPGGRMREQMLERFDADGDGKLNDEEKAAIEKEIQNRRAEMLQRFDQDGDGKLSDEEREAAREARRQGPPPPTTRQKGAE